MRYRTKGLGLGDQYTAEIMPDSMSWPKDGEMEEEFQRGVDARKQGKVSFLEVEEEKTREVVDEMKPGAQISLFRIKGRASEGVITHQNLALVQYHPKRGYRAERTGDGGTKNKSGGSNSKSWRRRFKSERKTLATAEKQSDKS